jgi:hypothetical protein
MWAWETTLSPRGWIPCALTQLWNSQDTLAKVDNYPVVTQTLQDLAEVCFVFFWRGAGDEKIVYVCVYEGKSSQNLIYKTLK